MKQDLLELVWSQEDWVCQHEVIQEYFCKEHNLISDVTIEQNVHLRLNKQLQRLTQRGQNNERERSRENDIFSSHFVIAVRVRQVVNTRSVSMCGEVKPDSTSLHLF